MLSFREGVGVPEAIIGRHSGFVKYDERGRRSGRLSGLNAPHKGCPGMVLHTYHGPVGMASCGCNEWVGKGMRWPAHQVAGL